MSFAAAQAMDELRDYLFKKVYLREEAQGEEVKVAHIIEELFNYYQKHPQELPGDCQKTRLQTGIVDYIAGMTDTFALSEYQRLFSL